MALSRASAALILLSLHIVSGIADAGFAAFGDAALFDEPGVGFTTRYHFGAQPARQLERRQSGCEAGHHLCAELGELGMGHCCPNTQYCLFNSSWAVSCCQFESNCGQVCAGNSISCNATTTITSLITPSGTASSFVEEVTRTSGYLGCCPRSCASTAFKCPSSIGAHCCLYGEDCVTGGCVAPGTSKPTLVPTYNGCSSTNMFSCATGVGCCTNGQACTTNDAGQGVCTGLPGNVTVSHELSQGAKAGIGAGVAIAAAAVIGALAWFCQHRRHEARTAEARTPTYRSRIQSPGPNAEEIMSETSGPSRVGGPHQNGLVYEYFGPDAIPGPYTCTEQEYTQRETPSVLDRGVPICPQGPGDIMSAVELDAEVTGAERDEGVRTPTATVTPVLEQEQGPFELWVPPGRSPSPLSPDERGPSSPGRFSPDPR